MPPFHQKWHPHMNTTKDFITYKYISYEWFYHLHRSRYKQSPTLHQGSWVADVWKSANGDIICESHTKIPALCESIREESTVLETYASIHNLRKRNWGNIKITINQISSLRDHLQQGNVSGACDGSVAGSKSAHVWCLFWTDTGEIIIQGCAPVDGIAENMTSTRTEIMGILAINTFLAWFNKTYFKSNSPIATYSNSKSEI